MIQNIKYCKKDRTILTRIKSPTVHHYDEVTGKAYYTLTISCPNYTPNPYTYLYWPPSNGHTELTYYVDDDGLEEGYLDIVEIREMGQ